MAAHRADGRQVSGVDAVDLHAAGEQRPGPAAEHHRRHALEHIARQGEGRSLFAIGAQDVGGAGVAAAFGADVFVVEQAAHHHAEVDAAEEIAHQQRDGARKEHRLDQSHGLHAPLR